MADYGGTNPHATVLSPEKYCFIFDTDNGDRVEFQLMPEVISESKSAMYNEIPIIGRSLPLLGYSSSGPRTMGLSLQFTATHKEGKYSPRWVQSRVRWLEAKTYPVYEDGFTYPPPRLIVQVGGIIALQCVMTSVNTSWMGPWAFDEYTATPFRAQVDCQFQEYGTNDDPAGHPHDHEEVKNDYHQSFEGSEASSLVEIPLVDLAPGGTG